MQTSTGKRRDRLTACFATVDPGVKGGVAVWEVDEIKGVATLISLEPMPVDAGLEMVDGEELAEMFFDAEVVYVEKVGSMPGNAGQRMFNFGASYGIVIGAAMASRREVRLVSPNSWMNVAHAGLLRSQESKSRSIYICMRDMGIALAKSQDGMADAVCLGIAIAKEHNWEIRNGYKKRDETGKNPSGRRVR